MTTYTPLKVSECPRCAAFTLVGTVAGFRFRIDTMTVPRADALVLHRYLFPVLIAQVRHEGIWADFWAPNTHRLTEPRRHLLIPHTCRRN